MISQFLFWALYPKMKTRKSRKFYKNAIILKYENVASKGVEILLKWHQTQNYSATLLIMWQVFGLLLKAFDMLMSCFSQFSKKQWSFTVIFKAYVKGKLRLIMWKLIQKHLDRNSNCTKKQRNKSLKWYVTQYFHVKIMPDCLRSVKKVSWYMCYKFQHFIS